MSPSGLPRRTSALLRVLDRTQAEKEGMRAFVAADRKEPTWHMHYTPKTKAKVHRPCWQSDHV